MLAGAGGEADAPRGSPPHPPTASGNAKIRIRNFFGDEHSADVAGLARVRDLSQPRILQMFFQGDELIPPASLIHWTLVREDKAEASDGGDSKGEQGPAPSVLPKNDAEMTDSEVVLPEDPDWESLLPVEGRAEDSDAVPDCFLDPDTEIDVDKLEQAVYQFGVGCVSYDLKRQPQERDFDSCCRINFNDAIHDLQSVDEAEAFFYSEAHYCGGVESQEKLKEIRGFCVPSSAFVFDSHLLAVSPNLDIRSKGHYNLVWAALNFSATDWRKYHKAIHGEFFAPSCREAFCWAAIYSAFFAGSTRQQPERVAILPPYRQEITAEDCQKLLRRALAALTEDGKNIDARRAANLFRTPTSYTTCPILPLQTRAQAEANPYYLYCKIILEGVASTGQIPAFTALLHEYFGLHECVLPDCKRYCRTSDHLPPFRFFFRDDGSRLTDPGAEFVDGVSRGLKELSSAFDNLCNAKTNSLHVIEYIIRNDLELECDVAPAINRLRSFAGLATAEKLQDVGVTFEYYRQLVGEYDRNGDDFGGTIKWTQIKNLWDADKDPVDADQRLRAKQVELSNDATAQQEEKIIADSDGIYGPSPGEGGVLRCRTCDVNLGGSLRALQAHLNLHEAGEFVRLVSEPGDYCVPVEEFLDGKSGNCIIPPKYTLKMRHVLPPERFLPDGEASKFKLTRIRCPVCASHEIPWPRKYQQKIGAKTRMQNHEKQCKKKMALKLDKEAD
ncbi:unnamed protein product [Amoebophrya sp. A120]|nr:unnamed protein product [Amoebophrya sp. A120]|eukprot:GSA120T00001717001.1